MSHPEDLIVWPDDVWCFRSELPEFTQKSDDFRVIAIDTIEWSDYLDEHDTVSPQPKY